MPADQQLALGKPADTAWWKQFQSPALDGLIAQAAAGSRDLTAAKARLARPRTDYRRQGRAAAASLAGRRNRRTGLQPGPAEFADAFNQHIASFHFLCPPAHRIFSAGHFRRQQAAVERARALADYESYELKAAYLTLYASIAADAFRNAGARAQIANLQDVIAGDQRNVTLVQTEIDAGSGTRTQLLSVQSQLSEDRTRSLISSRKRRCRAMPWRFSPARR